MKLPSGKTIKLTDPIIPGGNFTWHEALWSDRAGYHQEPASLVVEHNIFATARKMQDIRSILGNQPIRVNSWYRNQQVNAMVGGVPDSEHTKGIAVDFAHSVLTPKQVRSKLDARHIGGLGTYATFTHIDWRGYRARW